MSAVGHVLGIAASLAGIALLYRQRKRRFDRTDAYGVQRFPSYFGKLRAMAWDGFLWFAGAVLLSAGVIGLAHLHEATWGWLVMLPVYAYLLFLLFGT
jgi:4-hydroxybenzoate polyprenyltransferase